MKTPVIDSHQHVWDLSRASYDWLGPELAPIDRTISFDEAKPALFECGVDATVLVEAADNHADTELMIDTANSHSEVVGIVAYTPLEDPEETSRFISRVHGDNLVVGVRNLIHMNPDPNWLLRPDVDESLGLLEDAELTVDIVSVLPRHLELVPHISERHPRLRMVIDHLSKPPIGLNSMSPWRELISNAAKNPLVFAKLSGLYSATEDLSSWTVDLVKPFVDHSIDVFGCDRLMYGGDWPISILAGGYKRNWEGINDCLDGLNLNERAGVFGGNCIRFYRLDGKRVEVAVSNAS